MAEVIASELINIVLGKLVDEGVKYIVRAKGIESELNDLGNKLTIIQALLTDASDKETADKSVKIWLNRLQHLAYDIDDVLDGLATKAMHREFNTSKVTKLIPTFKLSNKLRHQLDTIATKLRQLEEDAQFLKLVVKDEKPKSTETMENFRTSRKNETSLPDSSEIIGREGKKKELLGKLFGDEPCKENFSVVPIVGMGGVGKTTLARSLYNETTVKDHFKLHAWVCVSDDFDVFKITETIYREMASENKEFKDLNGVQRALAEQLKEKRFLLVLDDIWSEKYVDWEILVKPLHSGAPGSKIIITTRKEGLLKQIGFDHPDKLEKLSHDDAMSLLARHALDVDNFDLHTDLKPHGEGIVKMCGCLPLALKVIGRLLRTKTNEQSWQQVLNNKIWQIDDNNIVPALRLSYLELSACLKQLFTYNSFFPKDFLFDKRELVLLWVAEGFIKQSAGSMLTEESLGHKYFEELLSRSFFQHAPNDESLFVMHDLLNDLATFVAEDFFLMLDDQTKTETLAKYRHMSFIRETYVGYQKFEAFKSAKSLRTFLPVSVGVKISSDCFYLSNKILVELLPGLLLLRVLSLSGFEISEVPECIVRLKHLRYLNLSQTKIKELPEYVGNLYNLQSLIVFSCDKLCKLPKSFSKLKNLRHLDIRDTPLLKKMPKGIGELNNLETLSKIIIEGDDGFTINELKELKNLAGNIEIMGLDKVIDGRHAQDANLLRKRLTEVRLVWDDVANDSRNETLENEVFNELKLSNDALKILKIKSYPGTKFPNWVGDLSFYKLVCVSIFECRNCKSLPTLGRLPSLKDLYIRGMDAVKVIGLELLGSEGVSFPSLEVLIFQSMLGWCEWSTYGGDVDAVFPCLGELRIYDCPELVDISLQALPSLRALVIEGCGEGVLRSLVCVGSSVNHLEIKNIAGLSDEVWSRVVMKNLGALEYLWVRCCNEIRYMWESEEEANKALVNLRALEVDGCSELVRLGEKEEGDCRGNLLTSLRFLRIINCDNFKDCNCPSSIEGLSIIKCSSVASVSFPRGEGEEEGGMEKLKVLEIEDCKELVVIGMKENINNKSMLEWVRIYGCPNLKSMNVSLNSIHLTFLSIWDCRNMESYPDLDLPNLTSLTDLRIAYCPIMGACFPPGNWPPELTILKLGWLKKPISEWAPLNYPTSLVELALYGGANDNEVRDLSQWSPHHLFPSNLTKLRLGGFEKLETVSEGLQHLTSLQHLEFWNCPRLKDLPEKLLPSLLSLTIDLCPKLKEKTSKRGGAFSFKSSYWPKISHIPCIMIDGELQN
uniref:putative disease resistance RPP13-like protein 1 n=1 Tax=Erigeron canadensis TaxID=72917 RepID=UPI001CB99815|nr:putative disease resistance RPP13-like protein 1 [Erigeron canadensis]XP_043628086.1 putative disease resistance RPP13-like protein 1 [Erigeron canadensis]XP_043628094.1 putative disease resistance RPP13-like protein 1 [Erigeron canadensis]